jgi:hypothetical protein
MGGRRILEHEIDSAQRLYIEKRRRGSQTGKA